jgi:hypothetical protein
MTQPAPTPMPVPAPPAPAPPAPAPTPVPPGPQPPVPAPQPVPVPAPPAPPEQPADTRDISHLPSWVQTEIRNTREEAARHRVAARTERVNNGVLLGAQQLGVNPQALMGSTAWAQRASQLDPAAADFQTQLQGAVAATLTEAPWIAATAAAPATAPPPPTPPTSGAEFPGGNGAGTPITEGQLAQMTPEQIAQAMSEGKLAHLL